MLKPINLLFCLSRGFASAHIKERADIIRHIRGPCYVPIYHFFNYLFVFTVPYFIMLPTTPQFPPED